MGVWWISSFVYPGQINFLHAAWPLNGCPTNQLPDSRQSVQNRRIHCGNEGRKSGLPRVRACPLDWRETELASRSEVPSSRQLHCCQNQGSLPAKGVIFSSAAKTSSRWTPLSRSWDPPSRSNESSPLWRAVHTHPVLTIHNPYESIPPVP